jgi:hypothetical protein
MTSIVLTPDAWVFTGGTSCDPERVVPDLAAALSTRLAMLALSCAHPLTKTIAATATPAAHIALFRPARIRGLQESGSSFEIGSTAAVQTKASHVPSPRALV